MIMLTVLGLGGREPRPLPYQHRVGTGRDMIRRTSMAIWARADTHATVGYSGAPAAPEMLSAPRGVTFLARSSPA